MKFDLNQLTATMDKGLLIIDVPTSEERAPKKISINRVTDSGEVEMEAAFPAVLSVVEKINEPRYPSFKGIMAAKKKEISTISLTANSGTEVLEANARPPRTAGLKIEDDGNAAQKLVDFLAERKLI